MSLTNFPEPQKIHCSGVCCYPNTSDQRGSERRHSNYFRIETFQRFLQAVSSQSLSSKSAALRVKNQDIPWTHGIWKANKTVGNTHLTRDPFVAVKGSRGGSSWREWTGEINFIYRNSLWMSHHQQLQTFLFVWASAEAAARTCLPVIDPLQVFMELSQ